MRFKTRPIDPISEILVRRPDSVWMSGDLGLWGWGEVARFHPGSGPGRGGHLVDRFRRLVAEAEVDDGVGMAGTGPVLFGSITFGERAAGSVGIVPRIVVGRKADHWWVTTTDGLPVPDPRPWPERSDRARYAGSSVPDVLWMGAVAESLERIARGELEKVVLARDYAVWSREPFASVALLDYLGRRFPACHVFAVDGLVGASPEMLIERSGSEIGSMVLAGSARRDPDPAVDRRLGEELAGSPKEQLEHELAVRSVRTALEPVTTQLDSPARPDLLRLDNVQHLATPFRGELSPSLDALTLALLLHPTAAVGGHPREVALDLIGELEGMERGRYAGPVGWVDYRGDGQFAIALRCAEISGARARLFAGAGIVAGSLPEAELEETRLKLGAMMGALGAV